MRVLACVLLLVIMAGCSAPVPEALPMKDTQETAA